MIKKNLRPYQVFTIFGAIFLFGILLSSFYSLQFRETKSALIFIVLIFLLSALVNFILKNKFLTLISWSLIIFLLTISFYSYKNQIFDGNISVGKYLISGSIVNNPEMTDKNQKIEVKATVDGRGQKLLIFAPKYPRLNYGDIVKVEGLIEVPKNFSEFNYQNYLKPKNIKYIIMKPDSIELVGHNWQPISRVIGGLYTLTNTMTASLKKVLPDPEAGLASGLVFGGKESLPESFTQNLQKTGLTHIVALSGYNVTIIFQIIGIILVVRIGRKRSFFISLILLAVFVLMTGAASSVLRASVFIVLVQAARLIGRKPDRMNVLLFTAVVMLLFNPFMLVYDMSFQLSFLAFIGLLYFAPWVEYLFFRKFKKIPEIIKLTLVQTLSAQLAVLPLLVASFGLVSVVAPLTNVLVLWIIPLAMGLSFLTSVSSLIYLPIAKLAVVVTWPVLFFIKTVVNLFASLPFASFAISKISIPVIIAVYAGVYVYYIHIKKVKIISYEHELEHGKLSL